MKSDQRGRSAMEILRILPWEFGYPFDMSVSDYLAARLPMILSDRLIFYSNEVRIIRKECKRILTAVLLNVKAV